MKHPRNRKGAPRVLDYDEIRTMIEAGMSNKVIADKVGSKRNYIGKLKGKWGLVQDKWAVE